MSRKYRVRKFRVRRQVSIDDTEKVQLALYQYPGCDSNDDVDREQLELHRRRQLMSHIIPPRGGTVCQDENGDVPLHVKDPLSLLLSE